MEGKGPSTPTKRELQGPRPAPLTVRRDSHKIKKPPPAPGPQPLPPRPPRPIIIYTVSPKVIHAEPSDFMALVQRLTGNSSSASSEPYSPAARLAVIEKAHVGGVAHHKSVSAAVKDYTDSTVVHGFDNFNVHGLNISGGNIVPTGILWPAPSALPATSPNFFSPTSDPNLMRFLHDLSPANFQGNYTSTSYTDQMNTMPNNMVSPTMQNLFNTRNNQISPRPPFDPFNLFRSW